MPDEQSRLEVALDQLYAAEPSEFVAVRKQLASELRAAGDKEAAKELAGARRPSTSAWALNQLARQRPQIVADFMERSRELRVAQTGPAAGDRDALREAIRAHREALDAAIDAALAVLGARANDSFRGEIVSTLRAAGTDTDVGRELRLGRVVRERASSSGFPETTGLSLVRSSPAPSAPTPTPTPKRAAKQASARELAAKDREAEARARAEGEHKAVLAQRDAALERAAEAEAEVASGEQTVARLEAELEHARGALREARAAYKKTRAEATRLSARADRPPG